MAVHDQSGFQYNDANYPSPTTYYCKTREEFDVAVGRDFITHANLVTGNGQEFFVGLAHGQSPAGAYNYILEHFDEIINPNLLKLTATNTHLRAQRNLKNVLSATEFLKRLLERNYITMEQVVGRRYNRERIQDYVDDFNPEVEAYLKAHDKEGFDYVFAVFNSEGRVAGITRNSEAFQSQEIYTVVKLRNQEEITVTPQFLKKSKRIAFLATKNEKRRPLAWLYSRFGKPNESPSFLRFVEEVEKRMTVFIDDTALNWPQIQIKRKSLYGESVIKVDTPKKYNPNAKKKLPVVLMVHGFLGLNSYDGLLISLPSHKYIAAAMHYGSIPQKLPPELYSMHVVNNIDAVVEYFGDNGHPVYLFDHSMGNIYYLLMQKHYDKLPGISQYLKGRIGANPFFGTKAKHAFTGFLDTVIIPSFKFAENPFQKTVLLGFRNGAMPLMPEWEVRRRGIQILGAAIKNDNIMSKSSWEAIKKQVIELMTGLDSLPVLNRIPIERALSRINPKIFAIQVYSCLVVASKLRHRGKHYAKQSGEIPVLILKSDRDGIAKYAENYYKDPKIKIMDVTDKKETDLFREHLYHMVNPMLTSGIIDKFIEEHQ